MLRQLVGMLTVDAPPLPATGVKGPASQRLVSRRVVGFFLRKLRWEFWPAWAAYLPLVPYLLYLGLRHRSLTLFTAANPGIESGGLIGESKAAILGQLQSEADLMASFETISGRLAPAERIQLALAFAEQRGLPVVLKPDVGERGAGVAIARSVRDVERYFEQATEDTIVQAYVPGVEFGIFYYRYPNEAEGRISSITEKQFPVITGDGHRSLRQLILDDARAVCQAQTYFRLTAHSLDATPARGKRMQLVEIGSHCRGAIFLDGARLVTPALQAAIERASQAHDGFYFGRYDVRASSVEELQAGRFKIIELNGVSAEATHIYDPAVSLWEAYRTLFQMWRVAFEIGAANRDLGHAPMSLAELKRLIIRCRQNGAAPGNKA